MRDIESNFPDNLPGKPPFSKSAFLTTYTLSTLVFQVLFGSGPLYLTDSEPIARTLYQMLSIIGYSVFSISIGFLAGYRLVTLVGFLIMALWPPVVQLSILYDSNALRNIGILTQWLLDCVLTGMTCVALYHFKHLGKRKLLKFCWIEAAVGVIANMAVLAIFPSNWLPWLFSAYCWAMLVLLYYTVPDTPRWLENVTLLGLLPHITGFVGYMLSAFVWLQYKGSFQNGFSFVLFLVVCVAAGLFSLAVLGLGFPQNWKEERRARLLRREEMNSWFRIEQEVSIP